MNWLRNLWKLYKTQQRVAKLNDIYRGSTRVTRRLAGFRWLHKSPAKKKLTRSQRRRLATLKIEPPVFTGFNPKKTKRYMNAWARRMAEARRKKRNG